MWGILQGTKAHSFKGEGIQRRHWFNSDHRRQFKLHRMDFLAAVTSGVPAQNRPACKSLP